MTTTTKTHPHSCRGYGLTGVSTIEHLRFERSGFNLVPIMDAKKGVKEFFYYDPGCSSCNSLGAKHYQTFLRAIDKSE